jgi:hypothetical protein
MEKRKIELMRFIFLDVPIDDAILATRAVRWLLERDYQKDAILAYGSGSGERYFYVKRNKSSITVRLC